MDTTTQDGIFVTGTNTGVGKTVVACAIARSLTTAGTAVAARKPVESNCERHGDALYPADGDALATATGYRYTLDDITGVRLAHALPPDRAARLEGIDLRLDDLLAHARSHRPGDYLLVEGAGGFLSPIAADGLNADLAVALGLPVLPVVGDRLGAINHALLTLEAITRRGLCVPAIVVNAASPPDGGAMDNADDLRGRVDVPVFRFPHDGDETDAHDIADCLLRNARRPS